MPSLRATRIGVQDSRTAPYAISSSRKTSARSGYCVDVRLLTSYIGKLDVHRIHDGTLEPFVDDRMASGATATTINRSLEVVRTILNRAARSYRDDEGRPWPETMPPLITMLFAVNTGLRESNVCGLDWTWEVAVPEVGSVFVIPPEASKSGRAYVVILNDTAWSIIETQRRLHPLWVFPYRGKQASTMNTTWRGSASDARRDCKLCAFTILWHEPASRPCVEYR